MIRLSTRFWRKVDRRAREGCWPWLGYTTPRGYGRMWAGRPRFAHRVSWELHHGPIPEGRLVCHHCDNPPCCNPAHLFLGTFKDNSDDMDRKGRRNVLCGEQSPRAKLTAATVLAIRARRSAGEAADALATEYGITRHYLLSIVRGDRWRRIDGDRVNFVQPVIQGGQS